MTSEGMALTGWTAEEEPAGLPNVPSSHLSGVTQNSLDGLTRPMEDQLVLVSKLIRRLQHLELPFLGGEDEEKTCCSSVTTRGSHHPNANAMFWFSVQTIFFTFFSQ